MISKELFYTAIKDIGLEITPDTFDKFDKYAVLLKEYNKKVNLTAITEPDDITVKHFADSLYLLKYVKIKPGNRLCDVGTGAGFPGVCLKLACPDAEVTLFDSVNKKLDFIRYLSLELDFSAEIVNIRAEDAGKSPFYREKFDIATARAVASLNKLSEYCVPLVKKGGLFAPLKAVLSDEEKADGICAARAFGAELREDAIYGLTTGEKREIIIFEKKSRTSPQYPRSGSLISKKPLIQQNKT